MCFFTPFYKKLFTAQKVPSTREITIEAHDLQHVEGSNVMSVVFGDKALTCSSVFHPNGANT